MTETVDDLKAKVEGLVEHRAELAYRLSGAHHHDVLQELATIHTAIVAIESVIASDKSRPERKKSFWDTEASTSRNNDK